MIKSELVQKIAKANPGLHQLDAEHIVEAILSAITEALLRGERVELRGFGAFTVKKRRARIGRNPATGVKVSVADKYLPFFREGLEMHKRLNEEQIAGAKEQVQATPFERAMKRRVEGGWDRHR